MLPSNPISSFPSLAADLYFTLLVLTLSLSNLSLATVSSLGAFEHEYAQGKINEAELKAKGSRLGWAVDLLSRAAGVAVHLADFAGPEWEREMGLSELGGRPVDVSRDVALALSK